MAELRGSLQGRALIAAVFIAALVGGVVWLA